MDFGTIEALTQQVYPTTCCVIFKLQGLSLHKKHAELISSSISKQSDPALELGSRTSTTHIASRPPAK